MLPGDRLLVSELSRLGRSLSQVIQIVETLVRRKIPFIAIKEAIRVRRQGARHPGAVGQGCLQGLDSPKILDVSRSALYHFIQTRKIAPG